MADYGTLILKVLSESDRGDLCVLLLYQEQRLRSIQILFWFLQKLQRFLIRSMGNLIFYRNFFKIVWHVENNTLWFKISFLEMSP
jgi:hypothetical protein